MTTNFKIVSAVDYYKFQKEVETALYNNWKLHGPCQFPKVLERERDSDGIVSVYVPLVQNFHYITEKDINGENKRDTNGESIYVKTQTAIKGQWSQAFIK